ncbi:hypothetical protein Tco_0553359 [Tanacetum coccineum]
MIRSLMYLTASRPEIQFSTCLCTRYQANPKESYLIVVKRNLDFDYAGCNMDRKSTSGACQLLRGKLVCWSAKKQQSVAMGPELSNFIPTQYQLADIFTKPLDEPTFKRLIVKLDQIEFSFDEIAFTTNNEVALLYPSHPNLEYFREVSDFISKCYLKEAFTRAPNQYKEYLCEFWYTAKTLDDSKIWVFTPTRGIRGDIDYAKLIWEDIIHKLNKKTREKVAPYPRFISLLLEYMMPIYDNEELTINPTQVFSVHNWALKLNQHKGPPFTDHMKAICNIDVPVDS